MTSNSMTTNSMISMIEVSGNQTTYVAIQCIPFAVLSASYHEGFSDGG